MSFLRLISAGLVFIPCALFGLISKEREIKKTETLKGLITDIKELEQDIRFGRKKTADALSHLADVGKEKVVWKEIVVKTEKGCSLRDSIIEAFGKHVGHSVSDLLDKQIPDKSSFDSSVEAERLRSISEQLEDYRVTAEKKCYEKCRLTLSLSILVGAAAAILIL